MKNLLLAIIFIVATARSAAQNTVNFSLSEGQFTVAHQVAVLSNGNFVVAGVGQKSPSWVEKQQLFLAVFDQNKQLLFQQKFNTPQQDERYEIKEVLALPNEKFAIITERLQCDVANGLTSLQIFYKNGFQDWAVGTVDDYLLGDPNFHRLPNGNFLVVGDRKMLLLDGSDGHQISLTNLPDLSAQQYIRFAFFDPTSLDFVAMGDPKLQFWENIAPQGENPIYKLGKSTDLVGGLGMMKSLGDGRFLGSRTSETFEIMDKNFDTQPFGFSKKGCIDILVRKAEIYFLGVDAGKNWLVKTNFDGKILQEFSMPDSRFRVASLAVANQNIVVCGDVKTGQEEASNIWQGRQAWVAFQNPQDSVFEIGNTDVKIAEVIQKQSVRVEFFSSNKPYFNISGGKFKIKIEQKSGTPLEFVELNIQHEPYILSGICGALIPSKTVAFVQPNTDLELDFGDIFALGQANQPQKFCFFLASPNRQPDAFPADDVFCHEFTFTLPAAEPRENLAGVKIFPNPTTDGIFKIQTPAPALPATATLTDFLGKQIQDFGKINESEQQFLLPDGLPAGVYFLKIETEKGAVLIRKICFSKS